MISLSVIKNFFNRHRLLSNCIAYGTMCISAELSQQITMQKIRKKDSEFSLANIDIDALKRYSVIGFGVNPTLLFFWYNWLDKKYVGVAAKIITKKVLLDQFVMTPPLYAIFFTSMSIMERRENIFEECKIKFIPTFKTSCGFWLPVQIINFSLVPSAFRVIYVGLCSFVWINILCWIKRKEI